jgi:urease subunit alpha
MDGVEVVLDTATAVIDATGLIVTPGGIDTHVHWLSPQVCDAALAGGLTTLVIQDYGPVWNLGNNPPEGTAATWAALEAHAVNAALLVRASSSRPEPVEHSLRAGGAGLKIHEDVSAGPEQIRTALDIADRHDVQLAIHTDGLNEALSVEDTYAAFGGRTVHAFHIEGCGGGHAPDLLNLAGRERILTSSTSPTVPFGVHAEAEHLAMVPAVHVVAPGGVSGDWTALRARVRPRTMAAEGVLHDLGVIAMLSSDSQGMGRVGEVVRRAFQNAAWMRRLRGPEPGPGDNERALRHLAKVTINPAIAHGLAAHVGSLQPGRLADAVLWRPELFAVRPEIVLKSGIAAWGASGDPNATTMLAEPVLIRRQIGAEGAAAARRWTPSSRARGHASRSRGAASSPPPTWCATTAPGRSGWTRAPTRSRSTASPSTRRPWKRSNCRPDICSGRFHRSAHVSLLTSLPPMDGTPNNLPDAFSVDELDVDGVPVLTVHGDLDIGTAPRLCWRIDEARRRWIRALVLDLTQTDFCDSTGLRALAGAERELTAQRARMAVVVPANGPVARLFDVAGAYELFQVHPTRDAALAAVR